MNPDGTLSKIASGMKRFALNARNRPITHTFTHGARLAIYVTPEGEWHLQIWRDDVPPSPTEVKMFRAAFEVPHDCESERLGQTRVRCVWKETVREVG